MRYSPSHKDKVRNRIILQAARQFRRLGYAGVSIDRLMAKAGLTRGGFYGYFRSKAALFASVIRSQHEFVDRLRRRTGSNDLALRREAAQVARDYVSIEHRRGVLKGCGFASLAMETARSPAVSKRAYAEALRELIGEFQRGLDDTSALDERAVAVVCMSVGALLLANASDTDTELADRISTVAQQKIDEILLAR